MEEDPEGQWYHCRVNRTRPLCRVFRLLIGNEPAPERRKEIEPRCASENFVETAIAGSTIMIIFSVKLIFSRQRSGVAVMSEANDSA